MPGASVLNFSGKLMSRSFSFGPCGSALKLILKGIKWTRSQKASSSASRIWGLGLLRRNTVCVGAKSRGSLLRGLQTIVSPPVRSLTFAKPRGNPCRISLAHIILFPLRATYSGEAAELSFPLGSRRSISTPIGHASSPRTCFNVSNIVPLPFRPSSPCRIIKICSRVSPAME